MADEIGEETDDRQVEEAVGGEHDVGSGDGRVLAEQVERRVDDGDEDEARRQQQVPAETFADTVGRFGHVEVPLSPHLETALSSVAVLVTVRDEELGGMGQLDIPLHRTVSFRRCVTNGGVRQKGRQRVHSRQGGHDADADSMSVRRTVGQVEAQRSQRQSGYLIGEKCFQVNINKL